MRSREIRLQSRPLAAPEPANFELVDVEVPAPEQGQVVVRNAYISVDPYMRGRMNAGPSYAAPFELGEALQGGAVGTVVESRSEAFASGDLVLSNLGWREAFVGAPEALTRLDPDVDRVSDYLGVLGMPGMTAYVGLLDIGQPAAGETVFVSAAAGAVGSVVGQFAAIRSCRVVGSVGSAEKAAWITDDLGFDHAVNYRSEELGPALAAACPDGIDVYFDNVGYDHLEAAIAHMNPHGRIVACGSIAGYNAAQPRPGPTNLALIVRNRLTMRGFIVSDHADRRDAFLTDVRRWRAEGAIRSRETVIEGLERAPEALLGLFAGANIGKMVVQLDTG